VHEDSPPKRTKGPLVLAPLMVGLWIAIGVALVVVVLMMVF